MHPIPTPRKSAGILKNTATATVLSAVAGVGLALGGWTIAQSALPGQASLARGCSLAKKGVLMDAEAIERAIATRPEFREFLETLERAVLESDTRTLRSLVDHQALIDRVVAPAPETHVAQELASVYASGTLEAWRKVAVLEHYAGGHYRYLRPRTIDGRDGVLFRLAQDGDLMNYHLHEIVEGTDGSYRIADIYVVGLREAVSESLWRGLGHLLAETHPSVAPGGDPEGSMAFVESIRSIGKMSHAVAKQRYQEAIDRYSAMPEALQQVRDVLLLRIEAASKLSPLELDDALEEWKRLGYAERDVPLKFVDYHMARGRYETARDTALEVDEIIGGDPYLRARIGELNFAIANQVDKNRARRGAPRARRPGDNVSR